MRGKKMSTPTKERTQHDQEEYNKLLQEMSSDCQNRKVLQHLLFFGSITKAEAVDGYNIWRLEARIFELREMGVDIRTLMVENIHNGGHHAKYVLY